MVLAWLNGELVIGNVLIQHHACQWRRKIFCYELAITIYRKGIEAKIIDLAFIYRGIIGRYIRGTAAESIAVRTEHGWYQHVQVARRVEGVSVTLQLVGTTNCK